MKKEKFWMIILGLLTLVTVIGCACLIIFSPLTVNQLGSKKTASGTIPARISTNPLNWYKSEKNATKSAKKFSYGGKHEITFDGIAPYEKITMLFEGKTSGATILYETVTDVALDIEQSFPFDTTQFQHEEIVLVTTTFKKGNESSNGYFAFKAINPGGTVSTTESTIETSVANETTETSTEETKSEKTGFLDKAMNALKPEETAPAESAPIGTVAVETAPVGTTPAETATSSAETSVVANETTESAPTETSATNEATEPVAQVLFNGFELKTYSSEEEALDNASAISATAATNITLQALVDTQKTSRVRVYLENENKGNLSYENVMYSDNNWTVNISLTEYVGQKIIVALETSDTSFIPNIEPSYIAFKIQ